MFGKAWQWLAARLGGKPQRGLRFSVHRYPMYPSLWYPSATPDQQAGVQIQIHLEASNRATSAYWIVAAELANMPARQTVIGVRDASTRKFAPDNPLPPRQLTTISLQFLVETQSCPTAEPFHATVMLTDHVGGQHLVNVIMH